MNKPNPAPEPTMEEILASIRRIISDGDDAAAGSTAAAPAEEPAPEEAPADQVEAAPEPEAAAAEEPAGEDADIFDLTDDMVAEEPEEPAVEEVAAAPEPEAPEALEETETANADDVFDMVDVSEDEAPEENVSADDFDAVPAMTEPLVDPDNIDVAFDETAAVEPVAEDPEPVAAAPEPEPSLEEEPAAPAAGLMSPQSDAMVASAFGRLANTMLNQDPRTLEDLVGEMLRPMLKEWLDDNLPVLVERLVREEIDRVSRGRH